MTLNMAKQAQRPCQSERRSSGAARGDYEAFVPSDYVWSLLVAAWKSTSPLPTRLLPDDNIPKSFTIRGNIRHCLALEEDGIPELKDLWICIENDVIKKI
jgi:hypothetical protein